MNPADSLATPEQAAKAYGTTVTYIYKLASLHKWRKLKHVGRVFYHWDDVDKALGK